MVTKDQKQSEFQELWRASKNRLGYGPAGTLEAATGFGKTRVATNLLVEMNERNASRTGLVVVPTRYLKKQWEAELNKWKITNTVVRVINTQYKLRESYDFLVLDEIHNYAAPEFSALLQNTQYNFILGLTATLERHDDRHWLLQRHAPVLMRISLEECRQNKWVSDFIVYNLAIPMSDYDKEVYQNINGKYHKYFAHFKHDFDTAMGCLNKKYAYEYAKRNIQAPPGWQLSRKGMSREDFFWAQAKELQALAAMWNKKMRDRMNFVYKAPSKIYAAADLIRLHPDKKVITFSQSVEFADELTRELGDIAVSYHSQLEAQMIDGKKFGKIRLKRRALQLFNDGRTKVRVINTAIALDEGFNVEDIDMAIISSASSSKRQDVQRSGRAVRYVPGKMAVIVNLYIPKTRDEKWLKQRQQSRPITVNSINDVKFTRPAAATRTGNATRIA